MWILCLGYFTMINKKENITNKLCAKELLNGWHKYQKITLNHLSTLIKKRTETPQQTDSLNDCVACSANANAEATTVISSSSLRPCQPFHQSLSRPASPASVPPPSAPLSWHPPPRYRGRDWRASVSARVQSLARQIQNCSLKIVSGSTLNSSHLNSSGWVC